MDLSEPEISACILCSALWLRFAALVSMVHVLKHLLEIKAALINLLATRGAAEQAKTRLTYYHL